MAEEMTKVLARSLAQAGDVVTPIKISPTMDRTEIIRLFHANHADKAILLSLYEWKADTARRTMAIYNVEMEALDSNGEVLARKRVRGKDNLGGSVWPLDPQWNAQTAVPVAFQKKLEELV